MPSFISNKSLMISKNIYCRTHRKGHTIPDFDYDCHTNDASLCKFIPSTTKNVYRSQYYVSISIISVSALIFNHLFVYFLSHYIYLHHNLLYFSIVTSVHIPCSSVDKILFVRNTKKPSQT